MKPSIRGLTALVSLLILAFVLLMPATLVAGYAGPDCGCSTTETTSTYSTTSDTSTTESSSTTETTTTETTDSSTTETTTTTTTKVTTTTITPPPTSTDAGTTTQSQSGIALVVLAVLGLLGLLVAVLYGTQRPTGPELTLQQDMDAAAASQDPDRHGEAL